MRKKFSPTIIGAFVMGAIALLVIAVIALGSGKLFRETREYVLYFDTSVNGLRVGAPVKFKGVEIGSVKDIRLQLEKGLEVDNIPVIVELDLGRLTTRDASGDAIDDRLAFQRAINQGLRGQLLMESLVTGLLYVALDIFPGTPVKLVQRPDEKHQYPEIPTTPTTLEQAQDAVSRAMAKLEEMDFKGIVDSLTLTIQGIDKLTNSPELHSLLKSLERTMPKIEAAVAGMQELTVSLDSKVSSLTQNLEQTSEETRAAIMQASVTIKQTDAALKATETVMTNINGIVDPDSPALYELGRSMREVSAAARSLRLLSNYIERNPRALIFGKPDGEESR
jgi:paraquat-inducible protein B